MKLKVIYFVLIFNIFFTISVFGISVQIEGEGVHFTDVTGEPFIDSFNIIQVPLRITMERYEATINWDDQTNTAIVKKGEIEVEVPIATNYIICNGQKIDTGSVALVKDGRTYLPIRASSRGCKRLRPYLTLTVKSSFFDK